MISYRKGLVGFLLTVLAASAAAQTTVTTPGGTVNVVPLFTSSSTIGNSAITQSNGDVGVGTIGYAQLFNVGFGSFLLATGVANGGMYVTSGQAISPTSGFQLGYRFGQDSVMFQRGMFYDQISGRVSFINTNAVGTALQTTISERFTVLPNGNVGVGTTTPAALFEVNGNTQMDGNITMTGSGAGITFPNGGGTQTVAYTGITCGGDYAESVDVTGNRTNYEPGDVLVLDPDNPGKILKSIEAYSTSVSGIYSTKPGTLGRRQTTPKSPDEVPMAVVGIVPAKVSTENGPVKVGDLLVTSSTPGYAMKGTDRSRMLGAVVGKAMAKLDSGTGVIEVLVTLQ